MTRIPLPGQPGEALLQGMQTGGNLFSQMIQPRIQREQIAQHQSGLEQEWMRHLQNLELHKQQESRLQEAHKFASQLHPIQMQNLMAQTSLHQEQANQLAREQKLIERFMANQYGNGTGTEQQSVNQGMTTQQQQQTPLMYQMPGQGGPMSAINQPQQAQAPSKESLQQGFGAPKRQRVDPITAGAIKKRFGYDVNEETPIEKSSREISTAKEKEKSKIEEKYKSENLDSLEAAQDALSDIAQVNKLLGEPGTSEYDYSTSALGPLDEKLPAIRKGTRLFRGEFERLAGRMKANIARLEKGATSDKERAMIDRAEISSSDSWTAAKGKLKAQKEYLERLSDRKKLINDYMESGYSRSEALGKSMKQTEFSDIDDNEKKIKIRNKKTGEEREVTQEEYNYLLGKNK